MLQFGQMMVVGMRYPSAFLNMLSVITINALKYIYFYTGLPYLMDKYVDYFTINNSQEELNLA